jgi:hypothetical protein
LIKSSLMRPALALALVLGLSACGGKAGFTVGGTVTGLEHPGLVLSTNGMDTTVTPPATAGAATSFSFPKQIEYGEVYAVTLKSAPQHQFCTVANPKDTAGRLSEINVVVQCGLNSYSIGGSVSGLTADGLVLANGSTGGTFAPANGATTFAFTTAVTYGVTYGVTVLTQPAGLVCSVSNGTGVMGDANVGNIGVNCVPQ